MKHLGGMRIVSLQSIWPAKGSTYGLDSELIGGGHGYGLPASTGPIRPNQSMREYQWMAGRLTEKRVDEEGGRGSLSTVTQLRRGEEDGGASRRCSESMRDGRGGLVTSRGECLCEESDRDGRSGKNRSERRFPAKMAMAAVLSVLGG